MFIQAGKQYLIVNNMTSRI